MAGIAGILLYWHDSQGFTSAWMHSGAGIGFTTGALLGLIAFIFGVLTDRKLKAMAGARSQACPKGVDPAFGIQLLKRTLVLDTLGLHKKKKTAEIHPLADVVAEIAKFAPPPRTVK
jgi:hypothetical protein